jgi:redox-sensitive bicupin YhaK (pirin superfamily)
MKPAGYRDIQPEEIPVARLPGGGRVKVVAGTFGSDSGPIRGATTDPSYFDVELRPGESFSHAIDPSYTAFVYPFEGSLSIGGRGLATNNAGVLANGEVIEVAAGAQGARFLLLAGRPLGEPIVQYGPFVMNTREEIEQALRDYQSGELTR